MIGNDKADTLIPCKSIGFGGLLGNRDSNPNLLIQSKSFSPL